MSSTNHEATHSAVFFSLLSLPLRTRYLRQSTYNVGTHVTLQSSEESDTVQTVQKLRPYVKNIFSFPWVADSVVKQLPA